MADKLHTLGPWKIDGEWQTIFAKDTRNPDTGDWIICNLEAACDNQGLEDGEEDRANARLIAASPDLLESSWTAIALINQGKIEEAKHVLSIAVARAEDMDSSHSETEILRLMETHDTFCRCALHPDPRPEELVEEEIISDLDVLDEQSVSAPAA